MADLEGAAGILLNEEDGEPPSIGEFDALLGFESQQLEFLTGFTAQISPNLAKYNPV
jgi:hypothetical protein